MSRRSLKLRLLLFAGASVTLALIFSAFGLVVLFERHVERQVNAELDVHLTQLAAGLERDGTGNIAPSQWQGSFVMHARNRTRHTISRRPDR